MAFYENVDDIRLLDDAMEAGGMAWWLMEYPSGAVYFSPNKIKMLGYVEKDMSDFIHFSSFTNLIHPDDYDQAMLAMSNHITGKAETYQTKYRIKAKDGSYHTFFDRGKIVAKNKDGEIAIAGVVIDMSIGKELFA
jgi:PAS domain S-box-containing protein